MLLPSVLSAVLKAGAFGSLFMATLQAGPLIEAAHRDDLDKVRTLLESGAAAGEANRYGVTPLSLACQNGNAEMVTLLLKSGADAKAALPGNETPLHTASRTGMLRCVQALVEAGAEIDALEKSQQSPLMWAAADGHLAVVRYLLEQGADERQHRGALLADVPHRRLCNSESRRRWSSRRLLLDGRHRSRWRPRRRNLVTAILRRLARR